jgi:hypothetical protein
MGHRGQAEDKEQGEFGERHFSHVGFKRVLFKAKGQPLSFPFFLQQETEESYHCKHILNHFLFEIRLTG